MRAVTVVAGAASLVTAGVVAYNLPGPSHSHRTAGTRAAGHAAAPAATTRSGKDDGSGDDGGSAATTSKSTGSRHSAPAAGASPGASHATSGGS
jgi:hypothetical protein